ncbi:hypothetical protein [Gordonia sp. (in: high G+C Gram-positive bacteria)]|uniref:hypothetical protein n=1 Tax=Gordonia sp. (in: high G+C Gram-positive bacteria) TaxID=84139 RepID=UPI003341E422
MNERPLRYSSSSVERAEETLRSRSTASDPLAQMADHSNDRGGVGSHIKDSLFQSYSRRNAGVHVAVELVTTMNDHAIPSRGVPMSTDGDVNRRGVIPTTVAPVRAQRGFVAQSSRCGVQQRAPRTLAP